jgi:hypothetical protein
MKKKRRVFPKFKPGMVFTVANYDAFGVVFRTNSVGDPISYFFLDRSRMTDNNYVRPSNAVLVCDHGVSGFPDDGWAVVSSLPQFDAREWPLPIFLTMPWDRSPLKGAATMARLVDENLDTIETVPLGKIRELGYSADDGASGDVIVKNDLRNIVLTGDINAGRSYTVPNPKPDGGPDFHEYCRKHRAEWAALPDPEEEYQRWLEEHWPDRR